VGSTGAKAARTRRRAGAQSRHCAAAALRSSLAPSSVRSRRAPFAAAPATTAARPRGRGGATTATRGPDPAIRCEIAAMRGGMCACSAAPLLGRLVDRGSGGCGLRARAAALCLRGNFSRGVAGSPWRRARGRVGKGKWVLVYSCCPCLVFGHSARDSWGLFSCNFFL